MKNYIISRMNIDAGGREEFIAWHRKEHIPGASGIDGFGSEHRMFESLAIESENWTYVPDPEITVVYELADGVDLDGMAGSSEFGEWQSELSGRWGEKTDNVQSILVEQIFGKESPLDYDQLLIAQMNVEADREAEFHEWYNEIHIPQAGTIPGFGEDHRRYKIVPTSGSAPFDGTPVYTATYEIFEGADIQAGVDSEEYKAFSGDFLKRWRVGTTDEVSTMCRKLA